MRKTMLLCLLLIVFTYANAQNALTGKVTDSKTGSPVSGASVKVKHSKTGTSTDDNGNFTLQAKPGDILEISSIGYTTQSVSVTGGSNLTIVLEPNSTELKEIVFVGSRGAGRA